PLLRRGGTVSPPPACSFRDGMETLTRALHARHAEHIRLNEPVRSIERSGAGFTVVTSDARIAAEHVVITTPASASAQLLRGVAPQDAAAIAALRYNPLTVVHLNAQTNLRGLGYQVSLAEPLV